MFQRDAVRIVCFNKSAHTSITNAFCTDKGDPIRRGRGTTSNNKKVLMGRPRHQALWPHPTYTIVFLRHPLTRVLSVWNHLLHVLDDAYQPLLNLGFEKKMAFEDFCKHLLTFHPNFIGDQHLRPQVQQYRDRLDRIHAEGGVGCWVMFNNCKVIRTENLDDEWPEMVEWTKLSCTEKIERFNDQGEAFGLHMYDQNYALATKLIQFYREDYLAWCTRSLQAAI